MCSDLTIPSKRTRIESSSDSSEDVVFPSASGSSSNTDSENEYLFPSEDEMLASDATFQVCPTSAKAREANEPSDEEGKLLVTVAQVLISSCCQMLCVRFLSVNDVLSARKKFSSMSQTTQQQWIIDKIHENSHMIEKGSLLTQYVVAGRIVCEAAFCSVYGFSLARLSRARRRASFGQLVVEHGNLGRKRYTPRVEEAKTWMNRYFNLIGDKQPDKVQIHLPSWETQRDIYQRYRDDMEKVEIPEDEMIGLSTFYRIWHEEFPSVVIPEVRWWWFHFKMHVLNAITLWSNSLCFCFRKIGSASVTLV